MMFYNTISATTSANANVSVKSKTKIGKYVLLLVLLSSMHQHVNVNAIDIGNAIKNIGKNNQSQSSSSSTLITTRHGKKDHEQSQQQEMLDASTGTVTTMEPGKERQPVSCNEIMAKAVVLASEEKEIAFSERDDALHEAEIAVSRAELLEGQIHSALAEAKNITIEYEALKLMTDRLVDDIKKSTKEQIQEKEEQNELIVLGVKKEMDQLEKVMEDKMENVRRNAKDEIDVANNEANKRIASVREEMKVLNENTILKIKEIEQEAKNQIEAMETKFLTKEETLRVDSSKTITQIEEDAKAEVDEYKEQLIRLGRDMEALRQDTKEKIAKAKYEKEEAIQNAYAEFTAREVEAMENANQVQEDAKNRIEENGKELDRIVAETYKSAQAEYARIQKETGEKIEKIVQDYEMALDAKEKELEKTKDDALMKQKEMQSTIDSLNKELKKYKNTSSSLDAELSETQKELKYWKEIGMNPIHVNTTLIWQDAEILKTRAVTEAKLQTEKAFNNVLTKTTTIMKPYSDKLKKIYNEKLKETVETILIPIYTKNFSPLQRKVTQKFNEHMIPLYKQFMNKSQLLKKQIFIQICKSLGKTSGIILTTIKGSEAMENIVPLFVVSFLLNLEMDSSSFVAMVLKTIAFMMIYVFKWKLLSLLWKLIKLPFEIVWFLCPVRLLIGGKSSIGKSRAEINNRANQKNPNNPAYYSSRGTSKAEYNSSKGGKKLSHQKTE